MKIPASMLVVLLLVVSTAAAQDDDGFGLGFGDGFGRARAPAAAEPVDTTVVSRWKIGVSVRATNAHCAGIFATVPVPTDWPEQSVRILDALDDISPQVESHDFRTLDSGVKQLLITIPKLASGDEAHAYKVFEVTKRIQHPPANVENLRIPPRTSKELRIFMGKSPYIESTSPRIKKVAKEVTKGKAGAWETVETIYDWVRENVDYEEGPIKGALAALKEGKGDCEELTSLFVALCRANRIPARTVWIEGHCYPEFYLLDENGKGHWFPCQAAGTRNFGGMFDKRLILQKGDKFKVPEKRAEQRYVAEFLSAQSVRGSGGPEVKFVRTLVLDDRPVAGIR